MKRLLITGGAGFIGSNLIRRLLLTGDHYITCIDNFDGFYSRHQKELNIEDFPDSGNFRLIEGDVCNPADLELSGEIDGIIHLASKAGVRPSIQDPAAYLRVNAGGTQALLEFARVRKIKQFLFASSSSVYGMNPKVPWNENETPYPISPYASSKLSAEMLGHVYSHLFDIRFVCLRFFTVYGPGQRPDLAIHKFFDRILQNKPIPVFGDGLTMRDYTYVDDITDGIIAALDYRSSPFEIINIGNNQAISLRDLIQAIEAVCGHKAIIEHFPEQAGDAPMTYADISKAEKLLGYRPHTKLLYGLENFYGWYKTNQLKLRSPLLKDITISKNEVI